MPKAMERHLQAQADKLARSGKLKGTRKYRTLDQAKKAYVYGTMDKRKKAY